MKRGQERRAQARSSGNSSHDNARHERRAILVRARDSFTNLTLPLGVAARAPPHSRKKVGEGLGPHPLTRVTRYESPSTIVYRRPAAVMHLTTTLARLSLLSHFRALFSRPRASEAGNLKLGGAMMKNLPMTGKHRVGNRVHFATTRVHSRTILRPVDCAALSPQDRLE